MSKVLIVIGIVVYIALIYAVFLWYMDRRNNEPK